MTTVSGDGPKITTSGSGSSVTVTITTGSGGGGGGGTTMPTGSAGQVPQLATGGSTYELKTPNTANGLARLDGSATLPDILIPASIARDSEVTSAIDDLSGVTDAAAARTNLGLGTAATAATGDFQPVDSDLTAIAALTTTTFGRSLLTQADAAAARSTLGVGSGVATDTLWDAAGDLAYGTGADTGTRLALGSRGDMLIAGASAPEWDTRTPSGLDYTSTNVTGAIAETLPPQLLALANITPLTSGRIYLVGIHLPKGRTITSISFASATTALATGTNQWFTLCNSSRVTLRSTVNDTSTAWAANTIKTLALTSTFTTTYTGLHYVGIMVAATTVPSLRGATNSNAGPVVADVFQSDSGQTTAPANGTTLTKSTVTGTTPWAAVS